MVQPIPQHKKMELPSITKEKHDLWRDVDDLYNSAYGLLGEAVGFVHVIVQGQLVKLPHVDAIKLTNMIASLNSDVTASRNKLNVIYTEIAAKKENINLNPEDIFMVKMQLTQDINEWTNNYRKVVGASMQDIVDYTTDNTLTTSLDD